MLDLTNYLSGPPEIIIPALYKDKAFTKPVIFSYSSRKPNLPLALELPDDTILPLMNLLLIQASNNTGLAQFPPTAFMASNHLRAYHSNGYKNTLEDIGILTLSRQVIMINRDRLLKKEASLISTPESRRANAIVFRGIVDTVIGGRKIPIMVDGSPIGILPPQPS